MSQGSQDISQQFIGGGVIPGQLVGQEAVSKTYVDGQNAALDADISNVAASAAAAQGAINTHEASPTAHSAAAITYSGAVAASNVRQAIDQTNQRVSTIVTGAGASNTEILDARQPATGAPFPLLGARLNNVDAQLVETAEQLTGVVNIEQYKRLPLEVTDDGRFNRAIQSLSRGTIMIPDSVVYEVTSPIRINKQYIGLMGTGFSKIKNIGNKDTIMIETDDLSVIPFFAYLFGLDLEGNSISGHGVKVSYAYNVTIENLFIHDHGLDGVHSVHGMNSTIINSRFDRNRHGFQLTAIDNGHRSTTWTLLNCYCGTNRQAGGVMSGGDSNCLIKCLFEGNTNGGLYVTNDEVNPTLTNCYFEFNTGYSLNIDSGNSGSVVGGRFADENVNAHINLGNSTGWMINGTWHSTNSIGGTGVNITKSYVSGGNDVVVGCQLFGATPIGGRAGNVSVIDAKGIIDRFRFTTGEDIRITGQGKGIIMNSDDGLHNYRVHIADGAWVLTEI
ncbi:hypothetical protein BSK49_00975 [Paenibacillus odorifer]|uniref:right-handed parallel beta-helix repeat-containing protein n=1 Tax=Paenibacillus odorifer TaxID=189426 RepID=UPI00096CFD9A|nr:right-handed parallel beta-helix repeat-containing protein [Paenibacillus odorifer]OMD92988.1 hypothetical protein BSK49_00975 [Paenibacillus odorifer]